MFVAQADAFVGQPCRFAPTAMNPNDRRGESAYSPAMPIAGGSIVARAVPTSTITTSFTDMFDTKNTTAWTWSASQTVPFNDAGNNVVKSTGTGANHNANFNRSLYSLNHGDSIFVRLKVDAANTGSFGVAVADILTA
jgi:hypothetical protein